MTNRETYDQRAAKLRTGLRTWRIVRTASVTVTPRQENVIAHYWSVENGGGHLMFYEVTAADRRIVVAMCAAGTWETLEETTPDKCRDEQDREYYRETHEEAAREAAAVATERRRPPSGEKVH